MNKSQLVLLRLVATFLLIKNGSTTTLEIKDELRRRFPSFTWKQEDISNEMMNLEQELDNLTFIDTGDFRVYSLVPDTDMIKKATGIPTGTTTTLGKTLATLTAKPKKSPKIGKGKVYSGSTQNLSRTAVVDLMRDSKGKFYTVTFTKVDGSERVINGQTKKSNFMDNLGYINFRESNGNMRRVNPKTIKEISISGNIYKVK